MKTKMNKAPILVGPGMTAVIALALNFGLSACVSMSSLQTARTLEPGQSEWTVGAGSYSSKAITDAVGDEDASGTTVTVADKLTSPLIEVSYRQGIAKDWDFGLKTNLTSVNGDVKYSLVEGSEFALATGLGLNYFSVSVKSGGEESKVTVYDLVVPLLASYDFAPTFTLYGGPKIYQRMISGSGDTGSATLLGGTGGMKLGKSWGAYLEGSFFQSLGKKKFDGQQFNVAIFWDSNALF